MDEKENFIQAIKEDEYAEYELTSNLVLITDWEGDGSFNPYVLVTGDDNEAYTDKVMEELDEQMGDVFHHAHLQRDVQGEAIFYVPSGIELKI